LDRPSGYHSHAAQLGGGSTNMQHGGAMAARILVINPNSTTAVTHAIDDAMAPLRLPGGPEILCLTLAEGPPGVESQLDADRVILPLCRMIREHDLDADAFVIACFSDPGLFSVRDSTAKPVLGIAECGILTALTLGQRFGVISILARSVLRHLRYIGAMGLSQRLAGDLPVGLGVAELADRRTALARIVEVGRILRDRHGADVLVMGCAGMARYRGDLECGGADPGGRADPRRRSRWRSGACGSAGCGLPWRTDTDSSRDGPPRIPRPNRRRQLARAAVFVDRNKGEFSLGHLDPLALTLAQYPDLDVEGDRGSPRAGGFGVAANRIADMNRGQKGDIRDRDGRDPPAGIGRRRHLSGGIHQRHDPAAENIPLGIAVRRHSEGARGEFALRPGRIPLPFLVTHCCISKGRWHRMAHSTQ
jgi:allantoin racemase